MFAIVFHLVHVLMFVSFVNSYLFTQKPKINQYNKIPFSAIPLFATNTNQENTPLNYQQYGKHSISKLITKSVTSVVAVTSLLSIPSASYAVLVADAAPSRYPIIGRDDIMRSKTHGTSDSAVQSKLRWNCDVSLADRICNYNRNWAEMAGYWLTTSFIKDVDGNSEVTFYDSVTGLPLFIAPKGRSFQDWVAESTVHGWPSFRVRIYLYIIYTYVNIYILTLFS